MSSSSSLFLEKIVSHRVWQELVQLWLTVAKEEETTLLTEDILLKLLEPEFSNKQQSDIDKFLLLITPKFNAFLLRQTANDKTYRVTVTFERSTIINELTKFADRYKSNIAAVDYLKTNFIAKLTENTDSSAEFVVKAVKLLINSAEQSEPIYSQYSTPPMDKFFPYQVEQKRILEQIEIQIGQNLNLSEIIQAAIDRSCSFLKLDRLLIYQLDIPIKPNHHSFEPASKVDAITYEAKASDDAVSILYYQDEACWHESLECRNKYRQGFCLVVDDVESSHLNPCLKSSMAKLEVKSKVVMPIEVRNKLWGLAIAHQCSEHRKWQHRDIQFLRQIAEYIAIAVYNYQSYQQLQQQKQILEKQVKTQEQQIRDALIAAEAASKSKHDFLGSMSHELRTPLTCVIGLSSTLLQWSSAKERMSLSPEKQQQYLHIIQQSGKHLLGLINSILEFSDVESGKHLLNIQQLSLGELVKQSLELLEEEAIAKDITLREEIKIEPEQDRFFADRARLKEILFHILSNGVKFTPQGGEVILRIWREKHQVVFQIEDTGIGIATEEIPLLFEKFKQIEEFRQRVHGGTGLGLALTKKLIELHGGTIEVESAIEKGSIFTIYLPETSPEQLTKAGTNPQASCSKMVVLITEDEESATSICQLLNTIEYQVIWLTSSAMAVNQIELIHPEIVIIDRDCSVIGVKNIVSAVANSALAGNTSVALLCDRFDRNEWQKFIEYGVDEYLLKSMNPIQVLDKINRLVQSRDRALKD